MGATQDKRPWVRAALLGWLIGLWLLAVAGPAAAQRQALPDAATGSGGGLALTTELAVAPWSRAQLDAWWETLRRLEGSRQALPERWSPPADPQAWTPVVLPDQRNRQLGASSDEHPQFQMRWYRLRYTSTSARWSGSLGLYLPRLSTLAVAVLVRTDAGWLPVFDNQAGAREQWVRPIWSVFPGFLTEQLNRERSLEVMLAVPVLADAPFMVPRVRLGPREELQPVYRMRWAVQIGVPQATGLLLVVLGLFALSLWLRRREDPAYLLFALAAMGWLVRNLHYYVDLPRDPLLFDWFWWATHASMAWVMLLSFLFALRFTPRRYRRFERVLGGFVLLSTVLTMPMLTLPVDRVLTLHLVNAAVALGGTIFVAIEAWRNDDRDMRVITLGLCLALPLGVHDLGVLSGWGWPDHLFLMPFATLIVVACFLNAVQRRFLDALGQVEQANSQLGQRLAEQGAQLQAQHELLSEAERQQALLLERQRLMQDMHDGLGSSLLSAMVAVEQGRMPQEQVVEVLRECVDDLRLVIDSLEPVGHDLVSLLATMRYRLGKRLQAGGLMLEWDVQDLPPLAWLEPPDALHVLRLLQEALNNVLKHARATRVRIATRDLGERVEIRVEDDGLGFDLLTAQKGRGLRSQLKRAQRLGGSVHVDSRPGHGTRLSLRLPVQRPPAPAA